MKSTKKSLLASGLALLASVALLTGTTFAWFTDSVTNSGNKIQAGNLEVVFQQMDKTAGTYKDVTKDSPIFNYDRWEPGYSVSEAFKIGNNGSLALKYELNLIANGTVSALADVIDVYYKATASELKVNDLAAGMDELTAKGYVRAGTLREVLGEDSVAAKGHLEAKEADYAAVVLHMQESAGNDYQGLSIGTTFDIVLNATQYSSEQDGFGNSDYDTEAELPKVIGSSSHDSLQEAIGAAQAGDTVVLEEDQTIEKPLSISDDITLNLGASTITNNKTKQDGLKISGNDKDIVIKATTGGIALASEHCMRVNTQNSNITVDGGNYSVEGTNNAYFMEDGYGSATGGNTVTIQNVTYNGDRGVQFSGSNNNTILIKDSTFTTTGYSGLFIGGNNNVCTLENVTFSGNRLMAADSGHTGTDGYSVIHIKSGTYNCQLTTSDGCTISITGGTFSSDPTRYLAEGYTAEKGSDGMWTVAAE